MTADPEHTPLSGNCPDACNGRPPAPLSPSLQRERWSISQPGDDRAVMHAMVIAAARLPQTPGTRRDLWEVVAPQRPSTMWRWRLSGDSARTPRPRRPSRAPPCERSTTSACFTTNSRAIFAALLEFAILTQKIGGLCRSVKLRVQVQRIPGSTWQDVITAASDPKYYITARGDKKRA